MKKECLFIDVFTDRPYAGNQLAVFPDSAGLDDRRMQLLAKEINYSEITFITASGDGEADYTIRIFTPDREIPFAGHPTLGTAYAIARLLRWRPDGTTALRLRTGAGVIPVEFSGTMVWMRQNRPTFHRRHGDATAIAALVGLEARDLDAALPVEEVSTGNLMLIVPVNSLAAIRRAWGNAPLLKRFYEETGCLGPYCFTAETVEAGAHLHSRFFAPHMGILEDPATGSAAGPLAAYLLKHRTHGASFELINEQGYEMNRPSIIHLRGEVDADGYCVSVGGSCACVGSGAFEC